MTDREKNIAIAQFCGWWFGRWEGANDRSLVPPHQQPGVYSGWKLIPCDDDSVPFVQHSYTSAVVPDYCGDLNAMHEVESKLIEYTVIETFLRHLKNRVAPHNDWEEFLAVWCLTHATASQRAEALLKTIGKWKE